jgi:hypothetical protein
MNPEEASDDKQSRSTVWIGLVGVFDETNERLLEGAHGAYVNVLALARDSEDYQEQIEMALRRKGLRVFEIEELESFESRVGRCEVESTLKDLAKQVTETGLVTCGKFYPFEKTEE